MTEELVPVFVQTTRGKMQDGFGHPIGSELVVHVVESNRGTRTWFRITHVATGTRVATFRSQRSACRAARTVAHYFEASPGCTNVTALIAQLKTRADVPAVLKACQGFVF